MTLEEYELKELEKELSNKEGRLIKILSMHNNHIIVCSRETYCIMIKERFIRRN